MATGRYEISLLTLKKNISLIQQFVKYFSSLKEKILISAGLHNILDYLLTFTFVSSNLNTKKVV